MNETKLSDASPARAHKLRNFDLTVEEIRILKAIRDVTHSLEDIERKSAQPVRLEYFRSELRQLEDRLEEIRDNTLIR